METRHQWLSSACRWAKNHPKRASALGTFLLGCALAVASHGGGAQPFEQLGAGLVMGLGVGCMALGAGLLALSLQKE